MNFVLFVLDALTGQEKIINMFFISEEDARKYCTQNDLIFSRILSEQEYLILVQNHQNQRLMRQYYQRPQPQQIEQHQNVIHGEHEEPEPTPQPSPRRPVFVIINPLKIKPKFVTVNRRKR